MDQISRSATFVIAALIEIELLTLNDAFHEVNLCHPETLPHPKLWKSLCEYYRDEISYSTLLAIKKSNV